MMKAPQLYLILASLLASSIEARPRPQDGQVTAETAMTQVETRTTTVGGVTMTGDGYIDGSGQFVPGDSFASSISEVTATMDASTTESSTSESTSSGSTTSTSESASDSTSVSEAEATSSSSTTASASTTENLQSSTITAQPASTTSGDVTVVGGTTYFEPGVHEFLKGLLQMGGADESDIARFTEFNQPFDSANPPGGTTVSTSASASTTENLQSTTITAQPASTTTGDSMVVSGTTYFESGVYDLHKSLLSIGGADESEIAYFTEFNQPFDSASPPWGTTVTTALPADETSSDSVSVTASEKTVVGETTYFPYAEYTSLLPSIGSLGTSAWESFTKNNVIIDPSIGSLGVSAWESFTKNNVIIDSTTSSEGEGTSATSEEAGASMTSAEGESASSTSESGASITSPTSTESASYSASTTGGGFCFTTKSEDNGVTVVEYGPCQTGA